MAKWYKKAVMEDPPYNLKGWKKTKTTASRRRAALNSRPGNWTLKHKRLSAGRALQTLVNITTNKPTKKKAKADADYFFGLLRK